MVYIFETPTLQYMSLVNVAVSFWKFDLRIHEEILQILPELMDESSEFQLHARTYCMVCDDRDRDRNRPAAIILPEVCMLHDERDPIIKEENWPQIEDKVCEKLYRVPKNFENLLSNIIKLVGLEIRDWIMYLQYSVLGIYGVYTPWNKIINWINYTQWTPHGKIDEIKTAEALLLLEQDLTVEDKYKIACGFCLEDKIEKFWHQLSDVVKDFYIENACVRNVNKFRIINYWINMVTEIKTYGHNYDTMLEWAIRYYHKSAVKYFWSKLNEERRYRCILESSCHFKVVFNVADRRRGTAIMCFLLSKMSKDLLLDICTRKNFAFIFERLLLDWVCVEFYMGALIRIYPCFHPDKLYDLLRIIAEQTNSFQGEKYKEFFKDLLMKVSMEMKIYIIDHELTNNDNCCTKLCKSHDFDNVRLLLLDFSVETRKQIFLKCLCRVHEFDWEFFEKTVRELISVEDEMMSFKNECAQVAFNICLKLNFNNENQIENIDNFLRFCLSSQFEIKKLKRKLLHVLPKKLPKNGEMQLALMDKFLDRRFFSEKEISNFKKSLVYEHNEVVLCITNELLSECKQAPILSDKILNWCLFTSEEIIEFKKQKIANSDLVLDKLLYWIDEGKWELIEKCLTWCFFKEEI